MMRVHKSNEAVRCALCPRQLVIAWSYATWVHLPSSGGARWNGES